MSFFKDTGTTEDLNAMLAAFDIEPERKRASAFEISRHCAHCNKEVRVPRAENPDEKGEYHGVICNRCYEIEMEGQARDSAYADLMNKRYASHTNRMEDLRDIGVIVLEDYRED
jgi:hypothetical protein|tara:strand:- start:317 stop:658 length:342 start_codon:yes stop_codon:yes gene_type:complete